MLVDIIIPVETEFLQATKKIKELDISLSASKLKGASESQLSGVESIDQEAKRRRGGSKRSSGLKSGTTLKNSAGEVKGARRRASIGLEGGSGGKLATGVAGKRLRKVGMVKAKKKSMEETVEELLLDCKQKS